MIEKKKAREILGMDFQRMKIPLNGADVSDIIFMNKELNKGCIYYNAFTGSKSKVMTDVVRKGRKFILLKMSKNQIIQGIYVKHDEVHDVLLVVAARLIENNGIWHWEEKKPDRNKATRTFFTKDCQNYVSMTFHREAIDMREQTIAIEDMGDKLPILNNSAMTSEIYKFFGGFISTNIGDYRSTFNVIMMEALIRAFNDDETIRKQHKTGAVLLYNTDEESRYDSTEICIINDMPIPEEAMAKMQKYAIKILKDSIEFDNEYSRKFYNYIPEFCIVQKNGDKVYQRIFRCMPNYSFPVKDTTFSLFESERIEYGSEVVKVSSDIMPYVIWRDDLTGTVMEFTADIIDDAIRLYDRKIKEKNYFLSELYKSLHNKCNIPVHGATFLAGAIGSYSFLESFYRIDRELGMNAMKIIARNILDNNDVKSVLENFFGNVDLQGKDINKAVGLPKGFLQCLFKGGENASAIHRIKYAKRVINATTESEKYFSRINKEDVEYMIANSGLREGMISNGIDCRHVWHDMEIMVNIYGYEKWKGFLRHINTLNNENNENNEVSLYYNYILALSSLESDVAKAADWKLTGEALEKAYDSLLIAKEYKKIERKIGCNITERFKDFSEKMKKYEFSYNGLTIRIPQKPEEIIAEGLYLKHCAKEFVIPISNGYTNILFIRKEDNPEKPYYTLELRDGVVRQCHGKCNNKAKKDVRDFINHFCAEKGVEMSQYDEMLGVN